MKTALLLIHVTGLAFGVGAATVLDLIIVRYFLRGPITKCQFGIVELASKLVAVGLLLLWVSGIGFLASNYLAGGQQLSNPKVWAKVSIVVILTANGFFIHGVVLPTLRGNIGFSLWHRVPDAKRNLMLVSGALSGVSWYSALLLGATPQLNYVVDATDILIVYGLLVGGAAVVSEFVLFKRELRLVNRFQAVGKSVDIAVPAANDDSRINQDGTGSVLHDTAKPFSPFRYASFWPVAGVFTAVAVLTVAITQNSGGPKVSKDLALDSSEAEVMERTDLSGAADGEQTPDSTAIFLPPTDSGALRPGKESGVLQHAAVPFPASPVPGKDQRSAPPAGASVPVARTNDEGSSVDIHELLRRAEADLSALRLTTPPLNNAWARFKRVLDHDPSNDRSRRGLQRILAHYVELARRASTGGNYHRTAVYVSRARAVVFGYQETEQGARATN